MNNIFAVYDSCSGIFGDPFIAVNDAAAKRMFEYAVISAQVPKYVRDDAVLYGLGFYDNSTGYFTADVPPYVVARGSCVVVPDDLPETSVNPEVSIDEE